MRVRRRSFEVGFSLSFALAALPAVGAPVVEKIALERDPAPGFGAGVTLADLNRGSASLNDAGEASFRARVTGGGTPGQADVAIYRDATILIRDGDPIPALPGSTYLVNSTATQTNDLNDAGQVTFFATPLPGTTAADAIFVDGTLVVAREGDPAPGTGAGVTLLALSPDPALNDAGQVLWGATLAGATLASDSALFRDQILLAREGDLAPSAAGALFGDQRPGSSAPGTARARMNDAGQVAFFTELSGALATNEAIYRDAALLARKGDPEPGGGGLLVTELSVAPQINASGQVAYALGLASGESAIYLDAAPIARTGDVAPGTGGATFAIVGVNNASSAEAGLALNDEGDVAFAATLDTSSPGVTAANDVVLYRGSDLVAREGDAAPGLPAGITLLSFFVAGSPTTDIGIDAAGRVAYRATLAGTGVIATNNEALFFWDGTASELIAREGDPIVGAGPLVGGAPLAIDEMNGAGQVLFSAVTNDAGTSEVGYFLASPDADADGFADVDDNCLYEPNPTQTDVGGIGAGAPPDGIGDACQCGDVSGNGRVTTADATLITRSLLVPPTATLTRPDLCNVGGNTACTTADAVIATRALLVPPTASVQQLCAAALP